MSIIVSNKTRNFCKGFTASKYLIQIQKGQSLLLLVYNQNFKMRTKRISDHVNSTKNPFNNDNFLVKQNYQKIMAKPQRPTPNIKVKYENSFEPTMITMAISPSKNFRSPSKEQDLYYIKRNNPFNTKIRLKDLVYQNNQKSQSLSKSHASFSLNSSDHSLNHKKQEKKQPPTKREQQQIDNVKLYGLDSLRYHYVPPISQYNNYYNYSTQNSRSSTIKQLKNRNENYNPYNNNNDLQHRISQQSKNKVTQPKEKPPQNQYNNDLQKNILVDNKADLRSSSVHSRTSIKNKNKPIEHKTTAQLPSNNEYKSQAIRRSVGSIDMEQYNSEASLEQQKKQVIEILTLKNKTYFYRQLKPRTKLIQNYMGNSQYYNL